MAALERIDKNTPVDDIMVLLERDGAVNYGRLLDEEAHVVLEDRCSDVKPAVPDGGEATQDTMIFRTASVGDRHEVTLS